MEELQKGKTETGATSLFLLQIHTDMRFLFLCLSVLYGQFLIAQKIEIAEVSTSETEFPATWEGDWKGTLDIYSGKGKIQSVSMQLEIHAIDTSKEKRYTFGMVYGSKEQDWRPYELVPVAPERGLWKVDEKNSIVMESYFYGPKLLCWFVVEGNRILCTYEKVDERTLVFEVMSGPEKEVSTTGQSKQGEEVIPPVKTFPFSVFQRAILSR